MIQRSNEPKETTFSVGLNVVLSGSKKMTPEEQNTAITVERVRVLIVDDTDPDSVLVDAILPAKEFKTGSVGYGLHERGFKFKKGEK